MNDQSTVNVNIQSTSSMPTIPAPSQKPGSNPTAKIIILGSVCVIGGLALGGILGIVLKNNQAKTTNKDSAQVISDNKKPFLIGAVAPLTGDGASYGIPAKQAMLVIEKEINNAGGFGGRPIKVIFEDGRCSSTDAELAGKKLIEEDKVELIYGGECSDEFLAIAPQAQKKKIITVSASATSPKISTLGKYVFRSIPSDNLAGKAAAQYAKNKLNAKTAAVIGENTNYGNALSRVFTDEFEKDGGKVEILEAFDTGATNFKDFIDKVNKTKVDLVYFVPQTPTPGVLIVQGLKNSKTTAKLLTSEVMLTRDEVIKQGKILDDLVGIEAYFDESKAQAKHIIELYQKEYGKEATYPTDLVAIYDLMKIYKEAYEKVGSNDTDKISEYLYGLKLWDGASGKITFDQNGDVISLPYAIQKIKDKKVSLLETYTVE